MPRYSHSYSILVGALAALSVTAAEAASTSSTRVRTNVSTGVSHYSNNGITVDDDVEINGPIVYGSNRVNGVEVSDNVVDVGNGTVRIDNGVVIEDSDLPWRQKVKVKKKVSQHANAGVGKQTYRDGDCVVERKWAGSMVKETTRCR